MKSNGLHIPPVIYSEARRKRLKSDPASGEGGIPELVAWVLACAAVSCRMHSVWDLQLQVQAQPGFSDDVCWPGHGGIAIIHVYIWYAENSTTEFKKSES
jgi:hypothetical protein